jgi:Tol biopolymer transport system component
LKKYQVALLVLLAVAAAITVGCGSSSVPTFTKTSMWSDRTVTPTTQLFTMGVDGSSITPVQTGSTNSIWGLSVSADFKTVAYASGGEVWGIGPNGGTPTQLTQNVANNTMSFDSRISPNGQKIVYPVFNSQSVGNIWIMNADGSGSMNLTPTLPTGMTDCYVASFSADSSKVVFACGGNSSSGLYTVKTDGTQLATVLTQSTEIDSPSFTPNGKQIVFISWGTPGAALKHGLSRMSFGRYSQHAQPNLAPISSAQGVASVNLDGSNPTIIVSATSNNPIWESEVLNSNLYYVTLDSTVNFYQIFKANLDGSSAASISDGTADDKLAVCGGC